MPRRVTPTRRQGPGARPGGRGDRLPSCSGPAGTEAGQRPREGEGAVPTAEPVVSCQAALGPREAADFGGRDPALRAGSAFLTHPGRCPDAVSAGTGAATLPRTGTALFSEDRYCRLEKVELVAWDRLNTIIVPRFYRLRPVLPHPGHPARDANQHKHRLALPSGPRGKCQTTQRPRGLAQF